MYFAQHYLLALPCPYIPEGLIRCTLVCPTFATASAAAAAAAASAFAASVASASAASAAATAAVEQHSLLWERRKWELR